MQNISFSLKNFEHKKATKKKKLINAAEECRLDASFLFTILKLACDEKKEDEEVVVVEIEQLFITFARCCFHKKTNRKPTRAYDVTIDVKLLKMLLGNALKCQLVVTGFLQTKLLRLNEISLLKG